MKTPRNTESKAAMTLISHVWGDVREARQTFPPGKTVETVSGGEVTAGRYEVVVYKGQPAVAVYGIVKTAGDLAMDRARQALA
jgi:hypothetical protein